MPTHSLKGLITGTDVLGQCYNKSTYFGKYECTDSTIMWNQYYDNDTTCSVPIETSQVSADGCAGGATFTCADYGERGGNIYVD